MKLPSRPVDVDVIRTDGGTQVREYLDEAWIVELVGLYQDGGHEIDQILLMEDAEGNLWLVDGFHRVEAMRRAGIESCAATVRRGTLDAAKFLAARMNKNGLPRTPGDKKRAVLLALSTADGKKMGVRELARHCGVSKSWAQEVLGARLSGTGQSSASRTGPVEQKPHKASVALLWARVDAALTEDDRRPSTAIAQEIDCHEEVVRKRRKALGLPDFTQADAARARPRPPTVTGAESLLKDHPEWTNARIAGVTGARPETVSKLRGNLGLPERRRGPVPGSNRAPAPSGAADGRQAETKIAMPRPKVIDAEPPPVESRDFRRLVAEAVRLPPDDQERLCRAVIDSMPAERRLRLARAILDSSSDMEAAE